MSVGFMVNFVKCSKDPREALPKLYKKLLNEGKNVKLLENKRNFLLVEAGAGIYFFFDKGVLMSAGSWSQLDNKDGYEGSLEERVNSFIMSAKLVYNYTKPEFAVATNEDDMGKKHPIQDVFIGWLTFFSPELVKKIGKEKLLAVPAYKIEELSDGGIFVQSSYLTGLTGLQSEEFKKIKNPTETEMDMFDQYAQEDKISEFLGLKQSKVKK